MNRSELILFCNFLIISIIPIIDSCKQDIHSHQREYLYRGMSRNMAEMDTLIHANAGSSIENDRKNRDDFNMISDHVLDGDGVRSLSNACSNNRLKHESERDSIAEKMQAMIENYENNHVSIKFKANYSGSFGEYDREYKQETVLVKSKGQIYALLHIQKTPLDFSLPDIPECIRGFITANGCSELIERLYFISEDPRIIAILVSATFCEMTAIKPFLLSNAIKREGILFVVSREKICSSMNMKACNEGYAHLTQDRIIADRDPLSSQKGKSFCYEGDLCFDDLDHFVGMAINNYCIAYMNSIQGVRSLGLGDDYSNRLAESVLAAQKADLALLKSEFQ